MVKWASEGKGPWRILDLIEEIHEIITSYRFSIRNILRGMNDKADFLAKEGVGLASRRLFCV